MKRLPLIAAIALMLAIAPRLHAQAPQRATKKTDTTTSAHKRASTASVKQAAKSAPTSASVKADTSAAKTVAKAGTKKHKRTHKPKADAKKAS